MSTDALPPMDEPEDVVEIDAPEVEEPEAPEFSPEVEAEARAHGWKPESEWKGAPPKYGFVGPDEFLENPKVQAKIWQDRFQKLEKTVDTVKSEAQERIERLARGQEEADRRRAENHRREIERLRADQRAAAENMDLDRFDAVTKELDELGPTPAVEEKPDGGVKPLPGEMEAVAAWRADPANSWFHANPYMRNAAIDFYTEAANAGINDGPGRLAYMQKRVGETFNIGQPQQTPRPRAAAVDGGGLAGRTKTRQLPPEAREAARRFIADGVFKDEKEYAEAYFREYGE